VTGPLGPGKVRGLQQLSRDGVFSILALDHRDSLRVELDAADPDGVAAADLTRFKLDVLAAVGDRPSGVMLDPEYGVVPAIASGSLDPSVGFLCALEAQGYLGRPGVTGNELLDGWSVAKTGRCGASAAKLLVLYRPDGGAVTAAQEELIRRVVDQCHDHDLALFVEPVPYDIADAADRRRVCLGSAERVAALGADVVKMPFPAATDDRAGWDAACADVTAAISVPWAVLSWGVSYEVFRDQVAAACGAGASGFMAGRAIWGGVVDSDERAAVVEREVIPRLDELTVIARSQATPWTARTDIVDPSIWDLSAY